VPTTKRERDYTENELVRKLMDACEAAMPGAVVTKHNDRTRSGWPDMSVAWNSHMSLWEVKHADPDFDLPGIQRLTCKRLATQMTCCFVIYDSVTDVPATRIVEPRRMSEWRSAALLSIHGSYDHQWVAAFIKVTHS